MGFQTPQYNLGELLARARAGKIQLPDFQRGYVWDDERVRQLIVTVGVGHPMGVVLLLETGSQEVHFQARPIEATSPPDDQEAEHLVLDGQQRLTSMTQAFTGDGVVKTKDDGHRRYFIDVAKAVADSTNLADAVVSMPASGKRLTNFNKTVEFDVSTRALELAQGYFPVNLVYDDEAMNWLWGFEPGLSQKFMNQVLTPMKGYKIPAIELDKATSMDAVTTVFEKVNQGGIRLTVFELLTAKFAGDKSYYAAHGKAFQLREDWSDTEKKLQGHEVLDSFGNDDYLQAVTLAASRARPTATTARKEDVLKLTLDEYLTWSPKVTEALAWVAAFLDGQHIHTGGDLPYAKQVVPLAVLRVVLGQEVDVYGVHARLRQWFWSGIFGELYGGAIETRFARDVEQVPAWALDETGSVAAPKTVDDAYVTESRLQQLRTRNSAAYKGVYALLMAEGTKDWVYNQAFDKAHYLQLKVDIHHIFPKAWCGKNGIPWEQRESVVNKTPLSRTTNIKLSGNAPSVYRGTIRSNIKADDRIIDSLVRAHQIDPELLWTDNFQAFFADRRERLCRLVERATGKTVARDLVEGTE